MLLENRRFSVADETIQPLYRLNQAEAVVRLSVLDNRSGLSCGRVVDRLNVAFFLHMKLSFLKHWLNDPATVGAVAPSSRYLADAMTDGVEAFDAIVEVGAGTGAVTASLVRRHPSARLIIFELREQLATDLSRRFPQAHVVGGAFHKNVSVLHDLPAKTVFVSGLPFRSLSARVVEPTIAAFSELLHADKSRRLVQFTYQPRVPFVPPTGLYWRRIKTVWLNTPPANVWQLTSKAD